MLWYEVLQKPMYNGKMAVKQVVSQTISPTVGSFLYFTIDSWIIITILSMILMLILLRIVGIRLPAVYAFPLIPFVFPEEIVAKLPIAAFIASVFFFGSVLAYKKLEKRPRSKINQVNE
ncbi:VIT1/CCC1 family predicted Fe2+/Mn2+ transporter [Cytobacillus horneckiae]